MALFAGFVAPIRLADRLRRYLSCSLCSLRALQDGTLAVSSSANVSGPGLWVSYLRGKRNQATDELTALLEELVEELYPGAQEEHRRAKAAALALREGRDVETGIEDVPQMASSSRADDFDDELRKELEELRAEREVKKGKGKRPPSLISTSLSGVWCLLYTWADLSLAFCLVSSLQTLEQWTSTAVRLSMYLIPSSTSVDLTKTLYIFPPVTFFSLLPPVDPIQLTLHFLRRVSQTGVSHLKYVQRLLPVTRSCPATMEDIEATIKGHLYPPVFGQGTPLRVRSTLHLRDPLRPDWETDDISTLLRIPA